MAYQNSANHNGQNHIFNSTQKNIEGEKNNDKDEKALYKLMYNAPYGKTMEKVRNNSVQLVNNEKKLYKMCIKTKSYVTQNI